MHRNRDQKKTQTLQQIQRKHYKVEVNNIQFLKINMSKYESSRNTQPFHVNSFMLAKAYWQLNFFKKINMTTGFVPVEIISTTIDGPPGPTRGPTQDTIRGRIRLGLGGGGGVRAWARKVILLPYHPWGPVYLPTFGSPFGFIGWGCASHFGIVHIDRLGVIYCICKYVRHLVSQAGKTTVNQFFWGVLVLLRQVYYGFTMYCHA